MIRPGRAGRTTGASRGRQKYSILLLSMVNFLKVMMLACSDPRPRSQIIKCEDNILPQRPTNWRLTLEGGADALQLLLVLIRR